MNRPSPLPEVNVETLKLLLQVAWADDTLDPKEREAVVKLGPAWGVPQETMDLLLKHLDMGKPLPQPNLKLLREHQCQRVIIVTSWFHSRRALSSFRKYAPEIEFLSMPAPRTQLWKYERGYIASEYVKMILYGVRFGIFPWNT